MITFETCDFPMSIDEILGERRLVIEYEFEDEGLGYQVWAVSDDGDKETIKHLLSTNEKMAILKLIAQNEHEAYEQGVM
jgi:hypothetical protein